MDGKRLIHEITLTNFLSYGSGMEPFELQPLNVLIGPNNSGKSNLIAAMSLLQAAPTDLLEPIREGGGVEEWLWKGEGPGARAAIEVEVEYGAELLRHFLSFTSVGQRLAVDGEAVTGLEEQVGGGARVPYYRYGGAGGTSEVYDEDSGHLGLMPRVVSGNQSILKQLSVFAPDWPAPRLRHLADAFSGMRIYRELDVGRSGVLRKPQPTDLEEDFLYESGRNLAAVINGLDNRPAAIEPLLDRLKRFYEPVMKITTRVIGGTMQLMVHERALKEAIPATRLSDGTLRYLCLLSILCHPEPPPLICIEEPELGLHPDVLHSVAELLVEASQRTQLIVTTHSDLLVSALSEVPEAVVVCERTDAGTSLTRSTDIPGFSDWLKDYSLGELWLMGRMGGNP